MYICYVDEAGCTGMLASPRSSVQPVFAIAGVMVEQANLRELTRYFLTLKRQFFPGAILPNHQPPVHVLDWVLAEVKGADIRRQARSPSRRKRRHAIGFLDRFVRMLGYFDAKIIGRIWIKGIGTPMNGRSIYTYSIQAICDSFEHFLEAKSDYGFVIADSRTKPQNANVSYSFFTSKFKGAGDDHRRILEMPTFGHSENHVGIPMADLLCSALLFPIASFCYCTSHVQNLHVQPGFEILKNRYINDIRRLQYRYQTGDRWRGGITISDAIAQRSGALLFC
jgi:Protein of unknown function (DUF3800)